MTGMAKIRGSSVLPARREPLTLQTADGLRLVGELALPLERDPVATLICLHPLPTHGGMMDSQVFRKAAARLPALADLAVLRFNTRGTASEVFPMETRALCIAFFYAIGTAVGGIAGPVLFGRLIEAASADKDITQIAIGYFIGAALMIVGGIVAAFLGVRAEGQSLESIAQPLTAEDAQGSLASR